MIYKQCQNKTLSYTVVYSVWMLANIIMWHMQNELIFGISGYCNHGVKTSTDRSMSAMFILTIILEQGVYMAVGRLFALVMLCEWWTWTSPSW